MGRMYREPIADILTHDDAERRRRQQSGEAAAEESLKVRHAELNPS